MMNEYVNLKVAAAELKISKSKILRMVKEGKLKTFENDLDKRVKLVLKADVEQLKKPRPTK